MKIFVLFILLHSIFCFPLTIFKTITRSQTIWYIIRISMWLRAGKKKSNSIKNFTQFAALYIFRYFLLVLPKLLLFFQEMNFYFWYISLQFHSLLSQILTSLFIILYQYILHKNLLHIQDICKIFKSTRHYINYNGSYTVKKKHPRTTSITSRSILRLIWYFFFFINQNQFIYLQIHIIFFFSFIRKLVFSNIFQRMNYIIYVCCCNCQQLQKSDG